MKRNLLTLIITIFCCYVTFSQVTYVQTIHDGEGGIESIKYPKAIITDSSGTHLFIAAFNCVTHLKKDTNKSYSFSGTISYSSLTYDGLWNADEVDIDQDGRFIYVTGDQHLNIFSIENDTMIFIESLSDQDMLIGSASQSTALISPDNSTLYLATNGGTENALHVFRRDIRTGSLILENTIDTIWSGGDDFVDIKSDINGEYVYTSTYGYYSSAALCVFRRTGNFNLELVQALGELDGITDATRIIISNDTKNLYLCGSCKIKVFDILPDGTLSFRSELNVPDIFEVTASSDDRFLYLGATNNLFVMERDLNSGDLTLIQEIARDSSDYTGIQYVEDVYLASHDSLLYVADMYNNRFHIFYRDQETGIVDFWHELADLQGKVFGLTDVSDLKITNNDHYIFTGCSSGFYSINSFERSSDGTLKLKQTTMFEELGPPIGAPYLLVMDPDNRNLYMTSMYMFGIRHLAIDTINGSFKYLSSNTSEDAGIPVETFVNNAYISPDSSYLYLSTFDYMLTYEIGDSGKLFFRSKYTINENCDNGFKGVLSFALSNDNQYAYLCSYSDYHPRGITILKRKADGSLEYADKIPDIIGEKILITSDDRFIYTLGKKINCFSVNNVTAELTLFQQLDISSLGYSDVDNLKTAIFSNDGKAIIAASGHGKAILSFYRNIETGELQFMDIEIYSKYRDASAFGPKIVMSHDSKNVYLAEPFDGILNTYNADIPIGLPSEIGICSGSLKVSVDEGYNYLWSTGDTVNTIIVNEPGKYSIHVTDTLGREGHDEITIIYYEAPVVNIYPIELQNGSLKLIAEAEGGQWPYEYLWSDGTTYFWLYPDESSTNKNYSIIITDNHGCSAVDTIDIETGTYPEKIPGIIVTPNPVREILNISFENPNQDYTIELFNIYGEIVHSAALKAGVSNMSLDLSGYPAGYYLIKFHTGNKVTGVKILKR